jgi:membrane-bound ClpP family serine protease
VLVLGLILLLLDALLLGTGVLTTIGWVLIIVGLILLLLGAVGRSVGPRRYYF